jgi:uncharacterized membrane protein
MWPAIAAVGAWGLGAIAARHLHSFTLHQGLFPTDLDDARTLLATIAAALLTFTGVVFSITLVALQVASSQYSPRVLRTFVRQPVTKLALATFIATFVYSLTLLASVGTSTTAHTVPQGAVGVAFLLVMASVIVFVFFVHSTVRSMRVSYVIQAVFEETSRSIDAVFAPADTYRAADEPAFVDDPLRIVFEHDDAVLDGIDTHRLVELAREHDTVLRMRVRVGTFVTRGSLVAEAHGGTSPDTAEVLRACNCSPVRTLYQDPSYGARQLVDIAIRALSPAVNDPTTAVQVLDRLSGLLRMVATRPDPASCFMDASGAVRLAVDIPGFDALCELALTEIALFGAGSPQIPRRLIALYDDLGSLVTPERRVALARQRDAWMQTLASAGQPVIQPNVLGLG